jgi:hypothetical protein
MNSSAFIPKSSGRNQRLTPQTPLEIPAEQNQPARIRKVYAHREKRKDKGMKGTIVIMGMTQLRNGKN